MTIIFKIYYYIRLYHYSLVFLVFFFIYFHYLFTQTSSSGVGEGARGAWRGKRGRSDAGDREREGGGESQTITDTHMFRTTTDIGYAQLSKRDIDTTMTSTVRFIRCCKSEKETETKRQREAAWERIRNCDALLSASFHCPPSPTIHLNPPC